MTSKSTRDRGHYGHGHHHEHEEVHERTLARERRRDPPLSFTRDGDPESCVLPESGSHSQGSGRVADTGYRRGSSRSETEKNRRADSRQAGKGY
jgi:hypothetical protein